MMRPVTSMISSAIRSPSLRLRITSWTVLVSLVIQLILGGLILFFQRQDMNDLFNSRLETRARLLVRDIESLGRAPDDADLYRLTSEVPLASPIERSIAAVYDLGKRPLASTRRPPPTIADLGMPEITAPGSFIATRMMIAELDNENEPDPHSRILLMRFGSGAESDRIVAIATSDATFEQRLSLEARVLLLAIPAGLVGTAAGAWLISGLAISPLRDLRKMADAFAPENIRQDVKVPVVSAELAGFQRELGEARDKLRQAFQAQDRLISYASHELKTPIAVLLIQSETLNHANLPHEAVDFVASVRQEMRRLGQTIESFLMLTKLRGGRSLSKQDPCDLHDVVMDAVTACASAASQRGVVVRTQLADVASAPTVTGDRELLRTLLEHLLRHAIRASKRTQEVALEVDVIDDRCRIRVRDQGAGVSAAELGKLFDRFSDPSDPCHERGDLGLAIAQGIAELHGSRITASNLEPGGCMFELELPLAAPTPESPAESSPTSSAANGRAEFHGAFTRQAGPGAEAPAAKDSPPTGGVAH